MQITDVRIRKIEDGGKLKAVASVAFDEEFVVHDLKIIEGVNGLFIAMPSRKIRDGEFRDIAHPINNDMRSKLEKAIYEAYEAEMAKPAEEESEDLGGSLLF
ncbi:MAG: septation regulator SpoVG [Tissierellia bacterium]|nr:septation regulator SpoVG [Tissierellia bacterium]